MNKSFDVTRKPHRLIKLEEVNNLYSENKLELQEKIKFFCRFKRYVSRDDMQKAISTNSSTGTLMYTFSMKDLDLEDSNTHTISSKILLFESKGTAIFLDVSHINLPVLVINDEYALFGQFDLIDGITPMFFAHTVSPCGKIDQEILTKTLEILKYHQVIDY